MRLAQAVEAGVEELEVFDTKQGLVTPVVERNAEVDEEGETTEGKEVHSRDYVNNEIQYKSLQPLNCSTGDLHLIKRVSEQGIVNVLGLGQLDDILRSSYF